MLGKPIKLLSHYFMTVVLRKIDTDKRLMTNLELEAGVYDKPRQGAMPGGRTSAPMAKKARVVVGGRGRGGRGGVTRRTGGR